MSDCILTNRCQAPPSPAAVLPEQVSDYPIPDCGKQMLRLASRRRLVYARLLSVRSYRVQGR